MSEKPPTPPTPPASPASPTPPAPPTPPSEKKSSLWKWILGGCAGCGCLIAIGLIITFILGGTFIFQFTAEPKRAVIEHMEAIKKGDYAKAYIYLSSDLQEELSLTDFTNYIESHPNNYRGIREVKINSVNVNNNQAQVRGKVIYKDGEEAELKAFLIKEGSLWKISSITVSIRKEVN